MRGTRNDVWTLSVRDRSARIALQTKAEDRDSVFSPDGRWISYMSSGSGRWEVYVRAFPAELDGGVKEELAIAPGARLGPYEILAPLGPLLCHLQW